MIILIIIILLCFGGFAGNWGGSRYYGPGYSGTNYGPGFGIGTILIICLLIYLFGGFSGCSGPHMHLG